MASHTWISLNDVFNDVFLNASLFAFRVVFLPRCRVRLLMCFDEFPLWSNKCFTDLFTEYQELLLSTLKHAEFTVKKTR